MCVHTTVFTPSVFTSKFICVHTTVCTPLFLEDAPPPLVQLVLDRLHSILLTLRVSTNHLTFMLRVNNDKGEI